MQEPYLESPLRQFRRWVTARDAFDQKLTLLVSQISDVKLPHRPLLLEQFSCSITFELLSALMCSPYSEHSAQQEVVLPGNVPVCLALQGLDRIKWYLKLERATHAEHIPVSGSGLSSRNRAL